MKLYHFKIVLLLYYLINSILSNLIVNHDFSYNQINVNQLATYNSIHGWSCNTKCQLIQCHRPQNSANCTGNYLDLGLISQFSKITQLINIEQKGLHRLVIQYFNPISNQANRTLLAYFNSQIVSSISTTLSFNSSLDVKMADQQTIANYGINNLTITMIGGQLTHDGFMIKNVQLTKVTDNATEQYSIISLIDSSIDYQFARQIMRIPGGRVIWTNLMMFFTNFDRFQLYIFHNRNYSQNSLRFIKKINIIKQQQIDLLKDIVSKIMNSNKTIKSIDDQKENFRFKQRHQQSIDRKRVEQRLNGFEDGFIENQLDFLVYKVSSMCIIFGVFKLLFHALYNFPISLIFRKYYFYGTLAILIIEGSIQQFTFYLTMEIKMLFNFSFVQKLTNIFMVTALYITIMGSIILVLVLLSNYKKFIKYFHQNSNGNIAGVIASTIDRGVVCLLFGFVHRLLLQQPNIQIFMLIIIQLLWIASRLTFMRKRVYENRLLAIVWIIQGLLRIAFQISFYVYQNFEENRQLINNFHEYFIIIYISLMALEFVISFFEALRESFFILRRIYNYSFKNKNTISSTIQKNKQGDNKKSQQSGGKKRENQLIKGNLQIQNKQNQKRQLRKPIMKSKYKQKDVQIKDKKQNGLQGLRNEQTNKIIKLMPTQNILRSSYKKSEQNKGYREDQRHDQKYPSHLLKKQRKIKTARINKDNRLRVIIEEKEIQQK